MSSIHRIMMRVIALILIPPKGIEPVKGAAMELRRVLPEKIQLRTQRWPDTQQHAHRSQAGTAELALKPAPGGASKSSSLAAKGLDLQTVQQ